MKMEATQSSETLSYSNIAGRRNPEDLNLNWEAWANW